MEGADSFHSASKPIQGRTAFAGEPGSSVITKEDCPSEMSQKSPSGKPGNRASIFVTAPLVRIPSTLSSPSTQQEGVPGGSQSELLLMAGH